MKPISYGKFAPRAKRKEETVEYLNFSEISKVPFKTILDYLNLNYSETNKGELKGERFIVSQDKNLFLNPLGPEKGSIINFLAMYRKTDLRMAAAEIKKQFLDKKEPEEKKLPEYPFIYHDYLKEQGITEEEAKHFEMTYCKQGILRGMIAVMIRDLSGEKQGYIGKYLNKDGYFYPKGLKAGEYLYNLNRVSGDSIILTSNPFKVVKYHQAGKDNACSLLTPNLTETQINLLTGFTHIDIDLPMPMNAITRLSKLAYLKQV